LAEFVAHRIHEINTNTESLGSEPTRPRTQAIKDRERIVDCHAEIKDRTLSFTGLVASDVERSRHSIVVQQAKSENHSLSSRLKHFPASMQKKKGKRIFSTKSEVMSRYLEVGEEVRVLPFVR
jgi:hypothetical protein